MWRLVRCILGHQPAINLPDYILKKQLHPEYTAEQYLKKFNSLSSYLQKEINFCIVLKPYLYIKFSLYNSLYLLNILLTI